MNVIEKIKALLKEAELYHSMGLLNESMGKYQNASALIQGNEQLKSRTTLVAGISKKIRALEKDMRKVAEASDSPEVSEKVQDLIKKLFAFSAGDDHDTAALDGAMALAKFGQHERALLEFNELLKKDSVRVVAAKNIIRCHLTHTSADAAVDQYERWISSDIFKPGELNKLRIFLEGLLKKEGIDKQVSVAEAPMVTQQPTLEVPEIKEPKIEGLKLEVNEVQDDEVIDVNAVGITLADGPQKGQMVELNVSFQSGNVISLLISRADKDLIKLFNQGDTLKNVQFFSPIAMFEGSAIVSAKNQIESGPRRGDYSIDLKVAST